MNIVHDDAQHESMTDVLTPNNEIVLNEQWDDVFRASMTSTYTMQNYAH